MVLEHVWDYNVRLVIDLEDCRFRVFCQFIIKIFIVLFFFSSIYNMFLDINSKTSLPNINVYIDWRAMNAESIRLENFFLSSHFISPHLTKGGSKLSRPITTYLYLEFYPTSLSFPLKEVLGNDQLTERFPTHTKYCNASPTFFSLY